MFHRSLLIRIRPGRKGSEIRSARQPAVTDPPLGRRGRGDQGIILPAVEGAVVFDELGKGHGAVEIHVHPGVEHPGQLAQNVVFRAPGLVQVAVDHIAPLAVQNGIVAEDNMRVAVVDLVEVGDGF